MICESKFRAGDKVTVVKNTERTLQASCIGMVGKVVGTRSKDCLIRFSDGSVHAIFEDDLELCPGYVKEYAIGQDEGV